VLAELKQIVNCGDPFQKYQLIDKIGVGATGFKLKIKKFLHVNNKLEAIN
jgi:hypothetical protein